MNPIMIGCEKRIGCGLCVNDCPDAHLYLESKKAKATESGCIACGHCFAVCPMNAVKIAGYPDVKYQRIAPRKEAQAKVL